MRGLPLPFEERLARSYDRLSARLRDAGDYVAQHPIDVASRSLRAVSEESGVAPATFSRLARALDYENFEELRDAMRCKIARRVNGFADRAGRLQQDYGAGSDGFFTAHAAACLGNVAQMAETVDKAALRTVVERLHGARQVMLFGALGSTGIVEYLAYMADFCMGNWRLLNRMGASIGAGLSDLGPGDALMIVTKPPFSSAAARAAEMAHDQGAFVVVITDTHACPALRHASIHFIVPTESPHFYSSYVATLAFVEGLIGMLVGRAGRCAQERIATVEESNRRLREVSGG